MGQHAALTDEQRAAAKAPAGPLLIVAGPGSGKTLVLTARVVHLVRQGAAPGRLLALAFGAKAARELRARLVRALGERGAAVDVATFHSWGFRLIRRGHRELGLPSASPAVLSGAQARAVLRAAADTVRLDPARWSLETLALALDRLRQGDGDVAPPAPWPDLLAAYEGLLRQRGALDYAAMLAWPLRLFREQPGLLRALQDHYRAVLCDEVQDCCPAQYRLARDLAARHRHLVLVGDPRQAIYGWRGADGRVFRRFLEEFPERHIARLERNFRSSARIVALANALATPPGGALWTASPPGEPIRLYAASDEGEEAAFVADEAVRLLRSGRVAHAGEVAVLYRVNQQREPAARALRARGLLVRAGDDRCVQLRTIHQAKGAEWSAVFLIGLEEGLLPHDLALGNGGEEALAAERRLAYVAVTRARDRLYLTWCRQRRQGAILRCCRPYRFLAGPPAGLLAPAA